MKRYTSMTLEALNRLDAAAFTKAVGWVFEHSLERAESPDRILSAIFTLGGPADIREVCVGGTALV